MQPVSPCPASSWKTAQAAALVPHPLPCSSSHLHHPSISRPLRVSITSSPSVPLPSH
jgi:hypothetical protein